MTCTCKPVVVDYEAIIRDLKENGFKEEEWGPITFTPTNWPKDKPVPQSQKERLKKGLADGTIILNGEMDPRFVC